MNYAPPVFECEAIPPCPLSDLHPLSPEARVQVVRESQAIPTGHVRVGLTTQPVAPWSKVNIHDFMVALRTALKAGRQANSLRSAELQPLYESPSEMTAQSVAQVLRIAASAKNLATIQEIARDIALATTRRIFNEKAERRVARIPVQAFGEFFTCSASDAVTITREVLRRYGPWLESLEVNDVKLRVAPAEEAGILLESASLWIIVPDGADAKSVRAWLNAQLASENSEEFIHRLIALRTTRQTQTAPLTPIHFRHNVNDTRHEALTFDLPVSAEVSPPADMATIHRFFFSMEEWMTHALYHPQWGYYSQGQVKFGIDFATHPMIFQPYYGHMIAEAFFDMWQGMRNAGTLTTDDVFTLTELAAGHADWTKGILDFIDGQSRRPGDQGIAWQEFRRQARFVLVDVSPKTDEWAWEDKTIRQWREEGKLRVVREDVFDFLKKNPTPIKGTYYSNEMLDNIPAHYLRGHPDGRIGVAHYVPMLDSEAIRLLRKANVLSVPDIDRLGIEGAAWQAIPKVDFVNLMTVLQDQSHEKLIQDLRDHVHFVSCYPDITHIPELSEFNALHSPFIQSRLQAMDEHAHAFADEVLSRNPYYEELKGLTGMLGISIENEFTEWLADTRNQTEGKHASGTVLFFATPRYLTLLRLLSQTIEAGYFVAVDYMSSFADFLRDRYSASPYFHFDRHVNPDWRLQWGKFDLTYRPDTDFLQSAAGNAGMNTIFVGDEHHVAQGTSINLHDPDVQAQSALALAEMLIHEYVEKVIPMHNAPMEYLEDPRGFMRRCALGTQACPVGIDPAAFEILIKQLMATLAKTLKTVRESADSFADGNFKVMIFQKPGTDPHYSFPKKSA